MAFKAWGDESGSHAVRDPGTYLLQVLADRSCVDLVLESRGPADDSRDTALLQALRQGRRLSRDVRLSHAPGPAEPMLWIADAPCGAVTQHRDGAPQYLQALASRVAVDTI